MKKNGYLGRLLRRENCVSIETKKLKRGEKVSGRVGKEELKRKKEGISLDGVKELGKEIRV